MKSPELTRPLSIDFSKKYLAKKNILLGKTKILYRLKLLDIVLNLGFTFLDCEYQNVVQMCPELTKLLAKCRVHICRDRWDRRSRKIFVDCVNFSVNNANCEQNLPNPHILRKHLCHFYAKCANIGQIYTYCVNICATFTQSV